MRRTGLLILAFLLSPNFVGAQQSSTCEENLKVVSVQAQEYYADRDAKQKDKIMLRSQLNDALAQIQSLRAELAEAKKAAASKAEEPKK